MVKNCLLSFLIKLSLLTYRTTATLEKHLDFHHLHRQRRVLQVVKMGMVVVLRVFLQVQPLVIL